MKKMCGLYLVAELGIFMYLISLLQREMPSDLPLAHFFHLNLGALKNSSVFYKIPAVNCQSIANEEYDEEYAQYLFNIKYDPSEDELESDLDNCEVMDCQHKNCDNVCF